MPQTNRDGMTFDAWLDAARWPWNGDMNRARDLWLGCAKPTPPHHAEMPSRREERDEVPMAPEGTPTHVRYEDAKRTFAESAAIGFHVLIEDEDDHVLLVQGPFEGIRTAREFFREEMPKKKGLSVVNDDAKKACVVRVRRGRVVEEIETWTKARIHWHRD